MLRMVIVFVNGCSLIIFPKVYLVFVATVHASSCNAII